MSAPFKALIGYWRVCVCPFICLLFGRTLPTFQKEPAHLPWVCPTRLFFKVKYLLSFAFECVSAQTVAKFCQFSWQTHSCSLLYWRLYSFKVCPFSIFNILIHRWRCPKNQWGWGTVQQFVWPIPGVLLPRTQPDRYSYINKMSMCFFNIIIYMHHFLTSQ